MRCNVCNSDAVTKEYYLNCPYWRCNNCYSIQYSKECIEAMKKWEEKQRELDRKIVF